MATIVARKRADGPRVTARIRLKRNGELVHKESRTFSTKAPRRNGLGAREVQLADPEAQRVAKAGGVNLATLIRWYIDTFESISPWQRSQQNTLEFLEGHPIGQTDPLTLTADVLIDHVRQRRLSGLCPSTLS